MELLGDALIQVRIRVTENVLNSFIFGIIVVRDLTMGNKSSFKLKKAGRALGVASNC
jgi:hypothetical protein